jgi:hypothetical protein
MAQLVENVPKGAFDSEVFSGGEIHQYDFVVDLPVQHIG